MSVIIFIIILTVLIVSHEFGHFIVAKRSGIRVDEFAVGFPPRIWGKKKGETTYAINALPFGGYVKIFGESETEGIEKNHDYKRSLVAKSKWIQASVISAGVVFNILLAWMLISLSFLMGFPTSVSGSGYEAYVRDTFVMITSVVSESPAQVAGLKLGDKIISMSSGNGSVNISNPEEVQSFISAHGAEKIKINYKRSDANGTTVLMPIDGIVKDKPAIGISMDLVGTVKLPFYLAFWEGAKNTWFLLESTIRGLCGMIYQALIGEGSMASVSGPVGIVKLVGDASKLGFANLMGFTALISINLAVINLIPIPALDGGRLFFLGIEAVRRRPLNPKFAQGANALGFALLMILMVVVTYHDIVRLVVG